jgi:hypothetical protein
MILRQRKRWKKNNLAPDAQGKLARVAFVYQQKQGSAQ